MDTRELRKYLLPVLVSLGISISANFLHDRAKDWSSFERGYWFLLGTVVVAVQISYSIFLIKYAKWQTKKLFVERSNNFHNFAHNARDLAVKLMKRKPNPRQHHGQEIPVSLTGNSQYNYRGEIQELLESMTKLFTNLVPTDTKVTACLRERRSDDRLANVVDVGRRHRAG